MPYFGNYLNVWYLLQRGTPEAYKSMHIRTVSPEPILLTLTEEVMKMKAKSLAGKVTLVNVYVDLVVFTHIAGTS